MRDDTTIAFTDPAFADALSDLVRDGAQRIIKQAVQAELDAFLQAHSDRDDEGRRAVVRNGYQPERDVLTGVGPVSVALPKTRDRAGRGRRFSLGVVAAVLKKTRRLEAVLPWLYLKGVSTNDFDEALKALFGESVKGLSASTISRLKVGWENEYETSRARLARSRDGVSLGGRHLRQCARR